VPSQRLAPAGRTGNVGHVVQFHSTSIQFPQILNRDPVQVRFGYLTHVTIC
jgi:hypothetical protein